MSVKQKEYDFDANELLGALDETLQHTRGKITLRTTRVPLPKKAAPMPPEKVVALRHTLKSRLQIPMCSHRPTDGTSRSRERARRIRIGRTNSIFRGAANDGSGRIMRV